MFLSSSYLCYISYLSCLSEAICLILEIPEAKEHRVSFLLKIRTYLVISALSLGSCRAEKTRLPG